jgi:hypothetical protein
MQIRREEREKYLRLMRFPSDVESACQLHYFKRLATPT